MSSADGACREKTGANPGPGSPQSGSITARWHQNGLRDEVLEARGEKTRLNVSMCYIRPDEAVDRYCNGPGDVITCDYKDDV